MGKHLKEILRHNIKTRLLENIGKGDWACDGCKYFDFKTLNDYGFDKPLYYLIKKSQKLNLEHMSPKQYIYKIALGFGGLSYEDAMGQVNSELVKKYTQNMIDGNKFPIGYYTEGEGGQEGRHRALAAMKLGCKIIPVVSIKNLNDVDVENFIRKYKDANINDMEKLFRYFPFDGVTMLGYESFDERRENLMRKN